MGASRKSRKLFYKRNSNIKYKCNRDRRRKKVTTNVYSNLTIRSGDQSAYTKGTPGVEETEGGDPIIREPDILSSYDTEEKYYKDILGFSSPTEMAESMVAEYKAMSGSIKKYKGFYIGRYELTTNGEKTGESLTDQNWYNLYKACQNVVTGKENVKSTMIYGVQWDAVCDWLKQSGFDTDTDSSSWGNYSSSSKIDTGSDITYEANGIFDLAGNCWEWTQETYSTGYHVRRGGGYTSTFLGAPASVRQTNNPTYSSNGVSSRVTLILQ